MSGRSAAPTGVCWQTQRGNFVHDQLATGKKLRILMTIVDAHSRLCPATDPRFTYCGEDVMQTLKRVCSRIGGYPKTIRVDNVLCQENLVA